MSIFNDKCPVCEDENELFILSCNHAIHLKCAEQMFKIECPLCNVPVSNYPEAVVKSIESNSKKYQEQLTAEERQNIIDAINNVSNVSFIVEAIFTLQYLRSKGIPEIYIPHEIRIEHMLGYRPPSGWLQAVIIRDVTLNIYKDFDQEWLEAFDDDTLGDDDPFAMQNSMLRQRPLKVYVNSQLVVR